MARTPRTFSCRSRAEAKAGEILGKANQRGHDRKAMQTNQRKAISEVSDSEWSRFVRVLRLPVCTTPVFTEEGCMMIAPARRGLFLEARKMQRNQKISSRSAIPTRERLASRNENVHARTSGTKSGSQLRLYTAKIPDSFVRYRVRRDHEGVLCQRF